MAEILNFISSFWHIILTILGFSFIIFVHELGHFIMAKRAGVKVDKFYIGFDFGNLKIFSFVKNETEYGIGIFPFGGYVKLHGYEELPGHETEIKDLPKAHFHKKTVSERFGIMVGGVAMNFISAVFLILIMYGIGKEFAAPIIGSIHSVTTMNGGLKVDDKILEVNGKPVKTFLDVRKKVILAPKNEPISFKVERNKEKVELSFIPDINYDQGTPELGILPQKSLKILGIYDGAPAVLAGLKPGDIIESVNKTPISKHYEFVAIVEKNANQKITVDIIRDKQKQSIDMTPSRQPSYSMRFESGLNNDSPLEIKSVHPSSAAALAGLKPWDKIIAIENQPIHKTEDIAKILSETQNRAVNIEITRENQIMNLTITPIYNASERKYMLGITPSLEGELGSISNIEINGPAYNGGLRIGDIIVGINDQEIHSIAQLEQSLDKKYGQSIKVKYKRSGSENILEGQVQLRETGTDGFFTKLYRKSETLFSGNPYILDEYGLGVVFQKNFYLSQPKEGSTAALAGFQKGDKFIEASYSISEKEKPIVFTEENLPWGWSQIDMIYSEMASRMSIKNGKIQNANLTTNQLVLNIKYERNGTAFQTALTPNELQTNNKGYSGIEFDDENILYRYSSIGEAAGLVYTESIGMLEFTYDSFVKLITGKFTTNALSGPFGIIPLMHQIAKSGIVEMLWLVAMLSVNIGFLNLMPFPPLDGGALFFLIIEKIKGSPVSAKFQIMVANVGVLFLVGLMIFVTMNDISRLFR